MPSPYDTNYIETINAQANLMLNAKQKTVVLNENTIGILTEGTNSIEVLSSNDCYVREDGNVIIKATDVVREATKMDFHRLRLSYSFRYMLNNENFDGVESNSNDILDEIYAGDPQYAQLKSDVMEGDKFTTYDVTYTNGKTLAVAALCLFHNHLNNYSAAKSVASYNRRG